MIMNDEKIKYKILRSDKILSIENDNNIIVGYDSDYNDDGIIPFIQDYLSTNEIKSNSIMYTDHSGENHRISIHFYKPDRNGKLVRLSPVEASTYTNASDYYIVEVEKPKNVDRREIFDSAVSSNFQLVKDSLGSIAGNFDYNLKSYNGQTKESKFVFATHEAAQYFKDINSKLFRNIASEASAADIIAASYKVIDFTASKLSLSSSRQTVNGYTADDFTTFINNRIGEATNSLGLSHFSALSSFFDSNKNAGKITLDSLETISNNVIPFFNESEQDMLNTKEAVERFAGYIGKNSGKGKSLVGNSWNNVKKNFETYISLLDLGIKSSQYLSCVIKTAKQMIYDFIYPDEWIDDSNLPELELLKTSYSNQLTELNNSIEHYKDMQELVCIANSCYKNPSDDEIKELKNEEKMVTDALKDVEEQIKRIEDYNELIKKITTMIQEAIEQIKNSYAKPIYNIKGNVEFSSNFYVDLSLLGIDIYDEKVSDKYKDIIYYDKDTVGMDDKAKEMYQSLKQNWPDDMPEFKKIAIRRALTLYNKGITYPTKEKDKNGEYHRLGRHTTYKLYVDENDDTEFPSIMDCSSFVTDCLMAAGKEYVPGGNAAAYTDSYISSSTYKSIGEDQLSPGDLGFTSDYSHVGMYIGVDEKNNPVWIEVNGKGVVITNNGRKGDGNTFTEYRQYNPEG